MRFVAAIILSLVFTYFVIGGWKAIQLKRIRTERRRNIVANGRTVDIDQLRARITARSTVVGVSSRYGGEYWFIPEGEPELGDDANYLNGYLVFPLPARGVVAEICRSVGATYEPFTHIGIS